MYENIIKIIEIAFIPVVLVFLNFYLNKKFVDLKKDIIEIKNHFKEEEQEELLLRHIEDIKCVAIQKHYETIEHGTAIMYFNEQMLELTRTLLHFDISTRTFIFVKSLIIKTMNKIKNDIETYIGDDTNVFFKELYDFYLEAFILDLQQVYNDVYNSKKTRIINAVKMFTIKSNEIFCVMFEGEINEKDK